MNNRLVQKSKRLLSGIVVAAIATSMLPTLPAVAETGEKYPYTLFACSSAEGCKLLLTQEISALTVM